MKIGKKDTIMRTGIPFRLKLEITLVTKNSYRTLFFFRRVTTGNFVICTKGMPSYL